ncbi:hypothetical protein HZH66_003471 [Vespula vulgaris]|uniref:Uncharacterized protein n=1 Tax=Vespula vulgaris TaxID=7454 RepID=A0A834NC39_VESVU|nr:hypothetical protein HZH66_003471 [Vespula vulgaris]
MEMKNAKVNLLVVVRKAKKRTTQRSESSYYMSFRIPFFLVLGGSGFTSLSKYGDNKKIIRNPCSPLTISSVEPKLLQSCISRSQRLLLHIKNTPLLKTEQNTGTRAYMNLTHPVSRVSVVVLQARRAVSERSKCQRQKAKLFLSAARENDLRLGPVLAPLSL